MKKICHLSSAHSGLDVRIFLKECVSLAAAGYATHLVIRATTQDVEKAAEKGVSIHLLKSPAGRFSRMLKQAWHCYSIGRRLDADIYHIHDAELIPYGVILAISGKKVIYDVHEDLPKDILSKEWIPFWSRKIISKAASILEYIGAKWFFAVITATPFIRQRFAQFAPKVIDINNFPLTEELSATAADGAKQKEVCYVGGIALMRGVSEVIAAMGLAKSGARLNLVGGFSEPETESVVKRSSGWAHVNELGILGRGDVRTVLQRSFAGLVTFHPLPNHVDAQPNKMFEYMSAGLPVIASDFPLWNQIIVGNNCGLCVNPMSPDAIAQAIDRLADDPELARKMGANGRRAVVEKYNWAVEEARLLDFYREVCP